MVSLSSERQGGIGFSSGKKMEVLATVVVYFKPITIQYLAEVNGLVDDMNACNIYSLILTPIFDLTSFECKEVCPPRPSFCARLYISCGPWVLVTRQTSSISLRGATCHVCLECCCQSLSWLQALLGLALGKAWSIVSSRSDPHMLAAHKLVI